MATRWSAPIVWCILSPIIKWTRLSSSIRTWNHRYTYQNLTMTAFHIFWDTLRVKYLQTWKHTVKIVSRRIILFRPASRIAVENHCRFADRDKTNPLFFTEAFLKYTERQPWRICMLSSGKQHLTVLFSIWHFHGYSIDYEKVYSCNKRITFSPSQHHLPR